MAERPPALSKEALAALAAYRDATPMPEAARGRVRARLSEESRARPGWLWVAVGALAAGLLLWGAIGISDASRVPPDASANQAPMQAPQNSGETAAVAPTDPQSRTTRQPGVPQPSAQMAPAPLEKLEAIEPADVRRAPADPQHRAPPRRKTKPAPAAPPEPSPAPLPASRLGAENRLIARTWEQVRTKQYAKARQALAEHASEFPAGVLAPERRALLVIVGCLQHPESAAGKADAYVAKGPSTLLAKVRAACNEEIQAPK